MSDRKAEILDEAAALLQTRSYSSFSYQDLADLLGIRKASIHHHFRSKEDLGIALAERFRDEAKERLEEIVRLYEQPWDRFEAYLASVSDIMLAGDRICPSGVLQCEQNVVPEGVRAGVTALNQYTRGWLAGVLSRGRAVGTMQFAGSPEGQAALIVAALQGALQNARSEGPQIYRAVVAQIRAGLKQKE